MCIRDSVEANENVLGLGLNPILQHFLFVIHPPTLFLGYIGLIIPFVISAHMLVNKNFSEKLFKEMLIWSKVSWFFLTGGIVLGSYWAYSELGWGGWWFWDPVENISLIPWLLNTALIHSLQVSIKSNQLKLWSLNLGLYCFIASVFGTFLVRSNLIVSVHSFATDPLRGLFLIIIIAYLLAMTVRLNIKSISNFNEDSFNLLSRESFLLLNNIFFICSALVVFIGTVYPLFSEMILKTSVSVGAPYYNFAFNLLLAPLILFMAFAPQINWGKHEKKDKQIEKREALSSDEEIKILQTLVKQRKESIELYEKGGRNELVIIEKQEMEIINSYLPKMMSDDSIKNIVKSVIESSGANSMADMGKVMPEVMKQGKGLIDGKTAQKFVSEMLK